MNLRKLKNKFLTFFYGLFYGMKATEDSVFHQTDISSNHGSSIIKEVEDNRLSKALLKGEVTQQVEELRYMTYKVDKEAKEYKYYAPTLALKRNKQDSKFFKYDDSDQLELITSQSNEPLIETIKDAFEQLGGRGKRTEYRIKIERNFTPRYRIEEYITRLDVKKLDDTHVILDMLVSKYPNSLDFKSKGFVREIEKIRDEKIKSDVLDYEKISFVTHHARNLDDNIRFVFRNVWFKGVIEFDGHYIVRFKASFEQTDFDLTKEYFCKTMEDKYQNHDRKNDVLNFGDYLVKDEYVCQDCGKKVVANKQLIDEIEPYKGRDITKEDIDTDNPNVLEFIDMQISEQTFGKRLCSDCLKKYLKQMEENEDND